MKSIILISLSVCFLGCKPVELIPFLLKFENMELISGDPLGCVEKNQFLKNVSQGDILREGEVFYGEQKYNVRFDYDAKKSEAAFYKKEFKIVIKERPVDLISFVFTKDGSFFQMEWVNAGTGFIVNHPCEGFKMMAKLNFIPFIE